MPAMTNQIVSERSLNGQGMASSISQQVCHASALEVSTTKQTSIGRQYETELSRTRGADDWQQAGPHDQVAVNTKAEEANW